MKIIKPSYYEQFKCIGGACEFTCCQCWAIAADDNTKAKWEKLDSPIDNSKKLASYLKEDEEQTVIKLNNEKLCPLLNSCGLCEVVINYGEETLSDTCHLFPREKRLYEDRIEHNLSIGCRSVVDILFENDSFTLDETVTEGKNDDEEKVEEIYFDIRKKYIELMSDSEIEICDVLKAIFYFTVSIIYENVTAYDVIDNSLNLVKEVSNALKREDDVETYIECNEIMLDIMANYIKKGIYLNYISDIYENAMKLADEDYVSIDKTLIQQFEEEIAKYDNKIRLVLCEEIYDSMISDKGIVPTAMKLQWIALEYVVIRQFLFVRWIKERNISKDILRDTVALVFRIMGYCDEDVFEYLEDSFDNPVWEIGYLNFIL